MRQLYQYHYTNTHTHFRIRRHLLNVVWVSFYVSFECNVSLQLKFIYLLTFADHLITRISGILNLVFWLYFVCLNSQRRCHYSPSHTFTWNFLSSLIVLHKNIFDRYFYLLNTLIRHQCFQKRLKCAFMRIGSHGLHTDAAVISCCAAITINITPSHFHWIRIIYYFFDDSLESQIARDFKK